jgi:hypothetical protein
MYLSQIVFCMRTCTDKLGCVRLRAATHANMLHALDMQNENILRPYLSDSSAPPPSPARGHEGGASRVQHFK